jgi:hypothetical protein
MEADGGVLGQPLRRVPGVPVSGRALEIGLAAPLVALVLAACQPCTYADQVGCYVLNSCVGADCASTQAVDAGVSVSVLDGGAEDAGSGSGACDAASGDACDDDERDGGSP